MTETARPAAVREPHQKSSKRESTASVIAAQYPRFSYVSYFLSGDFSRLLFSCLGDVEDALRNS